MADFSATPGEIVNLREAVNDASRQTQKTYFIFLLISVYVAVIAASTTHEQLLRGSDVALPFLNVGIPIVGFYAILPLLYLPFHLNLMIQFFLLSRKVHNLNRIVPSNSLRGSGLLQHTSLFTQAFICTSSDSFRKILLGSLIFYTAIGLPIVLLLFVLIKFLPYHSGLITWFHRGAIGFALITVWIAWPKIRQNDGKWLSWLYYFVGQTREENQSTSWLWADRVWTGLNLLVGIVIVLFSISVATIPGEPLSNEWLIKYLDDYLDKEYGVRFPRNLDLHEKTLVKKAPPAEVIAEFVRRYGEGEGIRRAWGNKELVQGLDLRGRDLRFADFRNARLFHADFRKADLRGVKFNKANLQGAILKKANLRGKDLELVNLQSANLDSANLQGANLFAAKLQGAILDLAEFQGATLVNAQLQRAKLSNAKLQGANLLGAQLQGANLGSAKLQGADLRLAELQGSNLNDAVLLATNLKDANLRNAIMSEAELQGANLTGANLKGADLRTAKLQGADLKDAKIQGANLNGAFLYGADIRGARFNFSNLSDLNFDPMDKKKWQDLRDKIHESVPEGDRRKDAFERIKEAEERPIRAEEKAWKTIKSALMEINQVIEAQKKGLAAKEGSKRREEAYAIVKKAFDEISLWENKRLYFDKNIKADSALCDGTSSFLSGCLLLSNKPEDAENRAIKLEYAKIRARYLGEDLACRSKFVVRSYAKRFFEDAPASDKPHSELIFLQALVGFLLDKKCPAVVEGLKEWPEVESTLKQRKWEIEKLLE